MGNGTFGSLFNIFPEITYVVDRIGTPSWNLKSAVMHTYNIMLVYDGQAEFFCNDCRYVAGRGDLIFYKPGDTRQARTFSQNPVKCFAVDFQYTCPVFKNGRWEMIDSELPFSFSQSLNDEFLMIKLTELFSRLTKSALTVRYGTDADERAIFTEILILLLHYSERNQYNYSNVRKVERVVNYMTENYFRSLTLQELADYAHTSVSYLGSIFRSITGRSTIDYLIEIRLNRAKNLLRDGFSVSETSRLVGFNDIYYFSRAFKKHEGISPSKYMNMQLISNDNMLK